MSCPFNEEQLSQLKAFVEICKAQPQILQHPKLSFFRDYLVTLGVILPEVAQESKEFAASGDKCVFMDLNFIIINILLFKNVFFYLVFQ